MSEHIQLIDRSLTAKRYPPEPGTEWDCLLHGEVVGKIKYDSSPNYRGEQYIASYREIDSRYNDGYRDSYEGSYTTLYAAKVGLFKRKCEYFKANRETRRQKAPTAYLPAWDMDFYPTPSNVAGKLLSGVDWKNVRTVLEPSAGKGDLIECAKSAVRGWARRITRYYHDYDKLEFDCIEIDPNLQAMLVGNGHRVVHDDFLSFFSRKKYDLILMNPPFSDGDHHLLHALELCESGGQIACILNAETIRNPYTNTRQLLLRKLTTAGATIKYMDGAFTGAERRANVDVALINVNIPNSFVDDTAWENLKKAHDVHVGSETMNEIAPSDNIERLIREHDLMCDAGLSLMRIYNGLAPHIRSGTGEYDKEFISLSVGDSKCRGACNSEDANKFLRSVRSKYWHDLFALPELKDKMTSDMRNRYDELIGEMRNYEFSKFNIQQVVSRIMGELQTGVVDAILKCFDTLTDKYTFDDNIKNGNIHYFNGWKTNKAHYVGMRCIIPSYGCYASAWKKDKHGNYKDVLTDINPNSCFRILNDLEKAFDYLDKGETLSTDLFTQLKYAAAEGRSKKIQCKYFYVTFFKRGTCHIQFLDKKIVDRLNIFVGRNKAWLPPSYGKVHYNEMDDESRRVVDEFQGRIEYEIVMQNKDDYLIEAKAPLMLTE